MAKAKRRKPDDNAAENPQGKNTHGKNAKRRRKVAAALRSYFRLSSLVSNFLAALVWLGLAGALAIIYYANDLPAINEATLTRRPNVRLIDAGGWELANFGDIYGDSIDLKKLPAYVPAAIISVEDRRFYEHPGVDARGLARAIYTDIRARARLQGGSTITQQVAKNLFLSPDRTLSRKIREALLALKLERQFSKDQILSLYMNRVYFGSGIYGFEAASERYFGHPAKDLTVFQAAVLAGLLKAPTHYNPVREPERAKERAQIVLKTMVETGAITANESKLAFRTADKALTTAGKLNPENRARYFADWVLTQVDAYVGNSDKDLIVHTTLDGRLQAQAETTLAKRLDEFGAKQKVEQGAIIVMGTDGAVRAMVGGRDYETSQFNRATQALRQPGSSFKPFVYMAGVEAGYGPDDMVTDAPIKIGKWRPQNFSGTYEGPITIETAFAKSINTAAVRVAQHVGAKAVLAVAHRMGITQDLKPDLSLALGSGEVTLLDLTGAYVPFANGGSAVTPYAIELITDKDGAPLYGHQGGAIAQVMTPETLSVMNRLMTQVVTRGTGTAAAIGVPAAGKTGTTNDFRDAWFMGFTADYVTGVWVGNDSGAGMNKVTGGGLPARIWHDVMVSAEEGHAPRDLPGMERREASPDLISRFWQAITGN